MTFETLSEQHKRFVESYVACLNYRRAYQVAYPNCKNYTTARTEASKLGRSPTIKAAIQEKLKEVTITKDDILGRMIQLIEFDLTEFMVGDSIDFNALKESGYGWLVKGVKFGKFNELMLMDKDRALENLAKIMQMFSDNNISINLGNEISSREHLDQKMKSLHEKLNAYEGGK